MSRNATDTTSIKNDVKKTLLLLPRRFPAVFYSFSWLMIKIKRTTVKLGYNELGYNEHSVITNKFLDEIGHFTTQMNPVITNKNGRSRAVRYNRV